MQSAGSRVLAVPSLVRARVGQALAFTASVEPGAHTAGWVNQLGEPGPEPRHSRTLAHVGGLTAIGALLAYLAWRVLFTMPGGGWDSVAAWTLVVFEAVPLAGLTIRLVTLWDIDGRAPAPVDDLLTGMRVVVMIPTYNEPVEVVAPTIAASVAIAPAHETWVLDDGDREWLADLCAQYGARYVRRPVHDHAKAGNMNHALALIDQEVADGLPDVDVIAVLDCDHVPLPTFLTATLGWFDDPELALVQAPQNYYNAGAFDDDGYSGEQGVFFHVLLAGRNHDGAGPFWCGSTSLIRTAALREVGGISTDTIVEDMHTTLNLIRAGWKTAYHHQTLAVGLAPNTPEQYLLQRRRWGMGSMQVLVKERLWAAKRWLSWRNYYEYLSGTLWWLEGVATVGMFAIPALILISGAQTSTAGPLTFTLVFSLMFTLRIWGVHQLFRHHLHWPTAFALRIFRVPIGLACLWWLVTRRSLTFDVTPKAGADDRVRGRAPSVLLGLAAVVVALLVYAAIGVAGAVRWHATAGATVASAVWLALAAAALLLGLRRITAEEYATSRRNAHRIAIDAGVMLDGVEGELVDISVGGVAVRFPRTGVRPGDLVRLTLPAAPPVTLIVVRVDARAEQEGDVVSLRAVDGDWATLRTMSLWLFHTPPGVLEGLPPGVPAVAVTSRGISTEVAGVRDPGTRAVLGG